MNVVVVVAGTNGTVIYVKSWAMRNAPHLVHACHAIDPGARKDFM